MTKKHPFLSHPILFTIILAIVPLQLSAVLGILTAKLMNMWFHMGLNSETGTELGSFLACVFRILLSCVIILLMKRSCGKDFRYGFDGYNLKKGFHNLLFIQQN